MSRGPEAGRSLERALIDSASAAGATITIDDWRSQRWESATFTGARHAVEASAGEATHLERWLARLPAADLRLRGHLLADLRVTRAAWSADGVRFRIEALTVAQG